MKTKMPLFIAFVLFVFLVWMAYFNSSKSIGVESVDDDSEQTESVDEDKCCLSCD